ncbi:MAG: signal peptidase I [Syntrophomonadaceae bacterium]
MKEKPAWATINRDLKMMEKAMKAVHELVNWMVSIAVAVILAVLLNSFVLQPTEVLGSSMEPTLHSGEMVFLSKLPHTFNMNLTYGDIVVIDSRVHYERSWKDDLLESPLIQLIRRDPRYPKTSFWIKRIIGKPGDVLEIKNGRMYRNDELLEEPYVKEPMETWNQKFVVPNNSVFLMGDNRNNSQDSRAIGAVPTDHILGKMVFAN